jgi:protein TonB
LLKAATLHSLFGQVGARAVPVGASVVVHAAVIFTAVGHPGRADDTTADVVEVDVATLAPAPDEPEPARPPEAHDEPHAAAHHHTHPYPVPESHDWTPHDPSLVHVVAPAALPLPAAPAAPPPAPAPQVETSAPDHEELPHFAITVGVGPATVHGAVVAAAPPAAAQAGSSGGAPFEGDGDGPVPESSVTTPARLASGGAPPYPPEARELGIEASVPLELVVSASGAVESARSLTRAGHGLDEAAVGAVRGYRFVPATRGGRAVRVRMRWAMKFELR